MDTTHVKALLEAELALVTEELKTLGVQDPGNLHDWVATPEESNGGEADENVSADRAEDLEEREAIVANLETRYNATTAALARIEAGTYGVCEVCQAAIEEARLNANPAARTCTKHMDEEPTLPLM